MKRTHATIRGDVQGVGYRYTLRLVALERGVTGWVRNRRDGTVEAEIEGAPEDVDAVLGWMSAGPPGARVDSVDRADAAPTGETGFEVRSTG